MLYPLFGLHHSHSIQWNKSHAYSLFRSKLSVVVIVGETPVPPPPTVINIFGAVICPNPGFVIVTVFGTPFTTAQVAVALIPPAGGTNNDKVGSENKILSLDRLFV